MTKMMAEKRDLIAETMWRAEYTRATGKERSIPWSDVAYDDQQKYLYVADVVAAALSALEDEVRNEAAQMTTARSVMEAEIERLKEALETCRVLRRGDAVMHQMYMARARPT